MCNREERLLLSSFFEKFFGSKVDEYGEFYVDVYKYELTDMLNELKSWVYNVNLIDTIELSFVLKFKFYQTFGDTKLSSYYFENLALDLLTIWNSKKT